jgi:peptidoglycan/LPS O-acetylase OafA/YrhL
MTSSLPPVSTTPHIARLDVLRALAFLGVVAFHVSLAFPAMAVTWTHDVVDLSRWSVGRALLLPVSLGWLGVPLFFVLSGFCIHYSTLKRGGTIAVGEFYGRRFLRIYPAYLACVLVCAALERWLPYPDFSRWQVVSHVLMIHNFFDATLLGLNSPLWSLAVEMQFYLLYPFLLLVMRRRLSWGGCLAVALAASVAWQLGWSMVSAPDDIFIMRPAFCSPVMTWCVWILGAALAEAYVEQRRLFGRSGAWLVASGVLTLVSVALRPMEVQSYLFSSVFFAVLMQHYLEVRRPLLAVERALVPVGVISYSLYLWHSPILALTQRLAWTKLAHLGVWAQLAFAAAAVPLALLVVGWLSYRVLEVAVPAWLRAWVASWRER